jgi:hypothetical protein
MSAVVHAWVRWCAAGVRRAAARAEEVYPDHVSAEMRKVVAAASGLSKGRPYSVDI